MRTPAVLLGLALWALAGSLAAPPASAQAISATTADGRRVILNPDGTWRWAEQAAGRGTIPAGSQKLLNGKRVPYGIWFNEGKWAAKEDAAQGARTYMLTHTRGDGYAMVIEERLEASLDALRRVAIENAKKAAADATVVREERRQVNGLEVLLLQIDATINQIPFSYLGYYYTGAQGAVQIVTFTGRNLLREYEPDFLDLLNGFVIK